jgi:hypothetical protein
MRLKPHAGMESLLKQAGRDGRQSVLGDFAYQREGLTSRHGAILFHVFPLISYPLQPLLTLQIHIQPQGKRDHRNQGHPHQNRAFKGNTLKIHAKEAR